MVSPRGQGQGYRRAGERDPGEEGYKRGTLSPQNPCKGCTEHALAGHSAPWSGYSVTASGLPVWPSKLSGGRWAKGKQSGHPEEPVSLLRGDLGSFFRLTHPLAAGEVAPHWSIFTVWFLWRGAGRWVPPETHSKGHLLIRFYCI